MGTKGTPPDRGHPQDWDETLPCIGQPITLDREAELGVLDQDPDISLTDPYRDPYTD
jgi:hypothetical protein